MGLTGVPAGSRCGTLDAGGQCATTTGTCGTAPWPAGSWAVDASGPAWARPTTAPAPGPSGWMTWAAKGRRPRSATAPRGPGGSTTAATRRTWCWPALVLGAGRGPALGRLCSGTSEAGRGQTAPGFSQGHADEEDYPAWTWDPPSEEDLAQGTPAAGAPGHTVSWGSTRSPGVPSPEMRRLPGPGEERAQRGRGLHAPPAGFPQRPPDELAPSMLPRLQGP